jgi:hypothetical protein
VLTNLVNLVIDNILLSTVCGVFEQLLIERKQKSSGSADDEVLLRKKTPEKLSSAVELWTADFFGRQN